MLRPAPRARRQAPDRLRVDHVTLTGGEPFGRSDIWPLLDLLADHGVGVQIISNGGLVTDKIAERLAPYDVRYVQITLNGPDAALHEEHVGEGHFDKTIRGIEALRERGVAVVGCVVVTRLNAPVLDRILGRFDYSACGRSRSAASAPRATPSSTRPPSSVPRRPHRGLRQALTWARDQGMYISCTMPVRPACWRSPTTPRCNSGTAPSAPRCRSSRSGQMAAEELHRSATPRSAG